ncbi:hypothetical protein KIN20_019037 [Parelaphostrongylus tenuis]|uniref:Uncharacterized protein n=1 Tax=Parelaphostrongylus tenuis TaxID=148309 RepID=A0AAD5QS08_PARTN|nr:hypothetical protein KIN20_019037 [Parelaphostrongylus tenuis]
MSKGVLGGEKKDEELYFSDSDFESGVADIVRSETDEAYETAEECDSGDVKHCKEQVKQNAVEESFDDLD